MAAALEEMLARMRHLPERIAKLTERVPPAELQRAGVGGSWGAIEILAYLRDWGEVYLEWLHRILTEEEPDLEAIDSDLWPIERDYHALQPAHVLDSFRHLRAQLIDRLEALDEPAWQRTAIHPTLGRITLAQLVEQIDQQDQEQLKALKDVLL